MKPITKLKNSKTKPQSSKSSLQQQIINMETQPLKNNIDLISHSLLSKYTTAESNACAIFNLQKFMHQNQSNGYLGGSTQFCKEYDFTNVKLFLPKYYAFQEIKQIITKTIQTNTSHKSCSLLPHFYPPLQKYIIKNIHYHKQLINRKSYRKKYYDDLKSTEISQINYGKKISHGGINRLKILPKQILTDNIKNDSIAELKTLTGVIDKMCEKFRVKPHLQFLNTYLKQHNKKQYLKFKRNIEEDCSRIVENKSKERKIIKTKSPLPPKSKNKNNNRNKNALQKEVKQIYGLLNEKNNKNISNSPLSPLQRINGNKRVATVENSPISNVYFNNQLYLMATEQGDRIKQKKIKSLSKKLKSKATNRNYQNSRKKSLKMKKSNVW